MFLQQIQVPSFRLLVNSPLCSNASSIQQCQSWQPWLYCSTWLFGHTLMQPLSFFTPPSTCLSHLICKFDLLQQTSFLNALLVIQTRRSFPTLSSKKFTGNVVMDIMNTWTCHTSYLFLYFCCCLSLPFFFHQLECLSSQEKRPMWCQEDELIQPHGKWIDGWSKSYESLHKATNWLLRVKTRESGQTQLMQLAVSFWD